MNYLSITYPDINNGNGLRITLWLSGCSHHCKNCQNPQTWDENAGRKFTEKAKKKIFNILSKSYIDGITFSGGDPLYDGNEEHLLEFIKDIKWYYPNKTIWLYTGYTWEEIMFGNSLAKKEIIKKCDVVVDGEYIDDLHDASLAWKGSSNQRVIDVKRTLANNNIKIWSNK